MFRFFILLGVLLHYQANAQAVFVNNSVLSGAVVSINEMNGLEIQGNPYLDEIFVEGTLGINLEKPLPLKLRYNTFSGNVEYQGQDGRVYFVSPKHQVFSVRFGNYYLKNGFAKTEQQTEQSMYQILHDGETKLLKFTKGILTDVTTYNEAAKQKRYDSIEYYYVEIDGAMLKIKRNKDSILEALPKHKTELEAYIKTEKMKFKSWEEVVKLLVFYEAI